MTRHGITPKQRDILLIPVPFTDLSSSKRRPVLVLSKTSHNRKAPDMVVAAVTSNLAAGGVGITISSADLEQGSLPATSLVKPDKVYTLHRRLVVKRYGRLNEAAFERVLAALDDLLGRTTTI
jgi:mRNA interferase MazF